MDLVTMEHLMEMATKSKNLQNLQNFDFLGALEINGYEKY